MLRTALPLVLVSSVALAQAQFRERSVGPDVVVWDAVFVDIDADGDQDIVRTALDSVYLMRNDGSGRYTAETLSIQLTSYPVLAKGDMDGDGDADCVVVTPDLSQATLLRNDGGPVTVVPLGLPASTGNTGYAAAADFDLDGDLDIAVTPSLGNEVVLVNDGSGGFAVSTAPFAGVPVNFPGSLNVGDFNGDGAPDLILHTFNAVEILLNDGSGNFGRTPSTLPQFPVVQSVVVGDFDSDGVEDLFATVGTGFAGGSTSQLLRGDGAGGLRAPTIANFGGPYRLTAADLDNDGDLDVAGTSSSANQTALQVYLNDGTGVFAEVTASRVTPVQETLGRIAAGDADGDGDIDLFVGGFPLPVPSPQILMVNHERQIGITTPATLGGTMRLRISYQPGYGTGLGLALPFVGPLWTTPAQTPCGRVWLDPVQALALPFTAVIGTSGDARLNVAIPNDPGLLGNDVLLQALIFEPFDPNAPVRATGFERFQIR